jgi:hypothetical protein
VALNFLTILTGKVLMGYSPYASIGFGITLTEEAYDILLNEDGESSIPDTTFGFIGDLRGGEDDHVLVLTHTIQEVAYGPEDIHVAIRVDPEDLKQQLLDLLPSDIVDAKPRWLIWSSII